MAGVSVRLAVYCRLHRSNVPADAVPAVEKRVEVARRIEEVLTEISAINLELLARGELE